MRKSLLVATTATLALGMAGAAYAQTPAPVVDATASVSPSKAGTKSKPKSEKLKLSVKNSAESKTTASKITITLPSSLKVSTSGLDQCKVTDDELLADLDSCKKSVAGKGSANALVNPFATAPAPLNFRVTPMVGNKELLFYLAQVDSNGSLQPNGVKAILHGKISGRKMTIAIPTFLQQPAPGTYSALLGLQVELSEKKGDKALVTSTTCASKAHKVGVKVDFVPNPNPPAASSASDTAEAKCSK